MIAIYPEKIRHAKHADIVAHHAAYLVSCLGGTEKQQATASVNAVAFFYRGGNWVASVLHGVSTARTLMLREKCQRPSEPLDDEDHQCNDPLPHGVRQ